MNGIPRKLFKGFAWLVVLGVSGIALLLALFWFEHTFAVTLPEPTGPYAVGRAEYDWVDTTRIDSLAPVSGMHRELPIWIWYPAAEQTDPLPTTAEYLPDAWVVARKRVNGLVMTHLLTRDLSRVRPHAFANADVSSERERYQVLLFKPGLGALSPDYTTLAENLASHGYIVVASDAPYSAAVVVYDDGRVATRTRAGNPGHSLVGDPLDRALDRLVALWSADLVFVLNQLEELNRGGRPSPFAGRMALEPVGVFGHSFGGATAAQFCADESRCGAGLNIDGAPYGDVVRTGLEKPFLFLLSDHGDGSNPAGAEILSRVRSIANDLPNRPTEVTLQGSRHFNFSDQALLKERYVSRLLGALGPMGERRVLAATAPFLPMYMRHGEAKELE